MQISWFMKFVYILFSGIFLIYLALPAQSFPEKLPQSIQSTEPADLESVYRKSYFTDHDRSEIMAHYFNEYRKDVFTLPYLTYKLNYPPEEAQILIRDQTRSSFLEEIVHPLHQSIYINGYQPKDNKDIIFVEGKNWQHKVTVKYVSSALFVRIVIGISIIILVPILLVSLRFLSLDLFYVLKKFRI